MRIDTDRVKLATQLAGIIPRGAKVLGLITESDDCYCRNNCALVRFATGLYATMVGDVVRTIDQRIARAAVAEAVAEREVGTHVA